MEVEYKCRRCKTRIDRKAARCYGCGTVKPPSIDPLSRWVIAAVIVAFPFAIVAQFSPHATVAAAPQSPPPPKVVEVDWHTKDVSEDAYYTIQGFVQNRLKSPGSARFPPVDAARVSQVGAIPDQRYIVAAYVDSQNSFGALLRSNFVGVIQQTSKGHWTLQELHVTAR
jgi:hypothetical protein